MPKTEPADRGKDPLTHRIIGAIFQVSSELGPGMLESAYERALEIELGICGLDFQSQPIVPFSYRGVPIDRGFRPDFVIESQVILEVKAARKLLPAHDAQLITYLRLSKLHVGLLVNFHEHPILNGIKRFVV